MADQNHVDWLHEGMEAWNARRDSSAFRPDLSGVKLNLMTNLQGYNFERANFKDSTLVGVDLRNANLEHADLRNVVAPLTEFNDSILFGANLQQAKLMVPISVVRSYKEQISPRQSSHGLTLPTPTSDSLL